MLQIRHQGWLRPDQTQSLVWSFYVSIQYGTTGPGDSFSTTNTDEDRSLLASDWEKQSVWLRGHTCDVDGNYVCGHGLSRQPHLLLRGGEGRGLVPYDLSVNLVPLPSLRGLGPHGELGFVVLHWRSCGLDDKEEKWVNETGSGAKTREIKGKGKVEERYKRSKGWKTY